MKKLLAVFAILFPVAGFAAGFYQDAVFSEPGYSGALQVHFCETDGYDRLWLNTKDGGWWVADTAASVAILAVACESRYVEFYVNDPVAQTWSNVAFGPISGGPGVPE